MNWSFLVLLRDRSIAVSIAVVPPDMVCSCCGAGGGGGGIVVESGFAFGTKFCAGGGIVGACLQIESLG